MMRSLVVSVLMAWLVTLTTSSLAQVNTEAVRSDAHREGLSGRVEARFTGSTGNSEGVVAGGSARLQVLRKANLAFVHAAGSYSRLNQTTSVERGMVHARHNYEMARWLWSELFAQLEHDAFRRLTHRELLGVGMRFLVIETKDVDLFYGTSYFAEWEKLGRVHVDPEQQATFAHRWNNYIALSASLSNRLEVGAMVYFQPRFDVLSDWRLLQESFLEVGITDVVSTKVSVTMRHDSDPPAGVKTTDFALTNAFVAKF